MTDDLNPHEARLALTEVFADVLIDLAVEDQEDETSDEELEVIDETMLEVAGLLLDVVKLEVKKVKGDVVTCELTIPPFEGE